MERDPLKLLLVEDDRKLADALARGLEAEGFTLDVAHDGDDGAWLAAEGTYGAIILDLMLPGRDGLRITADLRGAGDWTPVLMLTARDAEVDVTRGLDHGADDYLGKPFSFPVLVARIHALLRRGTRLRPTPVDVGDLRIDRVQRRVWRAGQEVRLTARQFDVLEFLMRRPGDLLSKLEILDGVWGYEFEGDPNIVEVYIRRLRHAVDRPFGRHAIETVRGAGYRLRGDGG